MDEGADCFLKGQNHTQGATVKAVSLDRPFLLLLSEGRCTRSFLSVLGPCKRLEESEQMCQHCPWSDSAHPCAASAALLVMFIKPILGRNVIMGCNECKKKRRRSNI